MNLYVKKDSQSPAASLVASSAAGAAQVFFPQTVVNDILPVNVYLVDGSGGYDAISGGASYTVHIGIGVPGAEPTAGTWTATVGANTTSSLAFDISAANLSSTLNALASVIAAGGLTVTGTAPRFAVAWTATGDVPDITTNGAGLTPLSLVKVEIKVAGGTGVNEVVWLTLAQQLLTEQSTFTPSGDGWAGQISLRTAKAAEMLDGYAQRDLWASIAILDSSGNPLTVLLSPAVVLQTLSTSDPGSTFTPAATGFTEVDPVFSASPAAGITATDIFNWNEAYSWGNWANALAAVQSWVYTKFVSRANWPLYTVLNYGAKGDGVTDDTAAFAASASERGYVLVPAGYTFLVGAVVVTHDDIVIAGIGGVGQIKIKDATNDHLFTFNSISRVTVRDIRIDGNGANQSAGDALYFDGVTYGRIDNCEFYDCKTNDVGLINSTGIILTGNRLLSTTPFSQSASTYKAYGNKGLADYPGGIATCEQDGKTHRITSQLQGGNYILSTGEEITW